MSNDVKLEQLTEWRRDEVQAIGAAISIRCWHSLERAYNALRDKMDRVIHAPPTARHQPQRNVILEEAARFVEQRIGDTFLLAEELRALKATPAPASEREAVLGEALRTASLRFTEYAELHADKLLDGSLSEAQRQTIREKVDRNLRYAAEARAAILNGDET